jgi:hypothetical protein
MKRLVARLVFAIAFTAAMEGAGVQTVYVLPMSGRLDLYVAEWLARGKMVRVTTNAKSADAILTDHLGEDFEHKLDQILAKDDDEDDDDQASGSNPARYSPGRNQGTVFLVDAKTRRVLWSDYEKPPSYRSAGKLNREAEKIVKKLANNLSGGVSKQGP